MDLVFVSGVEKDYKALKSNESRMMREHEFLIMWKYCFNTWVEALSLILEFENASTWLSKNEVGEDLTPLRECGMTKERDKEINWTCLLKVKVIED